MRVKVYHRKKLKEKGGLVKARPPFKIYRTNNNSLYFGSGHFSLSTINSSRSI